MSLRHATGLLVILHLVTAPAAAQQPLNEQIKNLFRFGDCKDPLCLNSTVNAGNVHGGHYIPASTAGSNSVIGFLESAVGEAVSNIPVSAATSGVAYSFEGGAPTATATSAGPIFAERVQTLGRGRFLLGVSLTAVDFKAVRGVPLDNLIFRFVHADVAPVGVRGSPLLENDVIQVNTSLNFNLQAATLSLNYGLLERVDIGVSVPFVRTGLSGGSIARVLPFSFPTPHFFGTSANPSLSAASQIDASATGIGDVAARLKVNLGGSVRGAFGFLVDARFPTGDENQFLGAGKTSVRGVAIASARFGQFSPHVNVGYLYWSGKTISDAVLATAGFDNLLAPWATIAVDVISQWRVGTDPVQLPGAVVFTQPTEHTVQQTEIPNRRDNIVDGSVGFKFQVGHGATLTTNAIVPLNTGGIRGAIVGTVGLEYGF